MGFEKPDLEGGPEKRTFGQRSKVFFDKVGNEMNEALHSLGMGAVSTAACFELLKYLVAQSHPELANVQIPADWYMIGTAMLGATSHMAKKVMRGDVIKK
jgi:hypothetical protein